MANAIRFAGTIAPANTPCEGSHDDGATYRPVPITTVGTEQVGILTNVPTGNYAAGVAKFRAIGYPATTQSAGPLTVAGAVAAQAAFTGLYTDDADRSVSAVAPPNANTADVEVTTTGGQAYGPATGATRAGDTFRLFTSVAHDAGQVGFRMRSQGAQPASALVANATPLTVAPLNWRGFSFDGLGETMGNRHMLAGASPRTMATEVPFTYAGLPAGMNVSDSCAWERGASEPGRVFFAHSTYTGASNYYGGKIAIATCVFTANPAASVAVSVHVMIDFSEPGRIPAGIGGFPAGLGPQPILCSPEVRRLPNGRIRLYLMYQPNGINTSDSYIVHFDSTDATYLTWGNAVLDTGAAMPYGNGSFAGNQPGSYIDPQPFDVRGSTRTYLLLRAFSSDNHPDRCLGQRVVSAADYDSPYDVLESDLSTLAHGGLNPYVTNTMEGQWMQQLGDGRWRWFVDQYDQGGYKFAESATAALTPAGFGPFRAAQGPAAYPLRHFTPVYVTALAAAVAALVRVENTAAAWAVTGGFVANQNAAVGNNLASGNSITYCPRGQAGSMSLAFGGNTFVLGFPVLGAANPISIQISIDGGAPVTLNVPGAPNQSTGPRYTRTDCGPGRHTVVLSALAATNQDAYVDYVEVEAL